MPHSIIFSNIINVFQALRITNKNVIRDSEHTIGKIMIL